MNIVPRTKLNGLNGYAAHPFDITLKTKEYPLPNDYTTFVGIDPGTRNMGLAIFHGVIGKAFDIKVPKAEDRVISMQYIQESVHYLLTEQWADGASKGRWLVFIEDAAFGMKFGQVQLAESRAACMLYFAPLKAQIKIVAPARIRKVVFGDGRKKAQEVWKILPNAGAAVSCAIYGMLSCE